MEAVIWYFPEKIPTPIMLHVIELPDLCDSPPSAEAEALLVEADRRVDEFLYRRRGPLIHGFVVSDFRAVDRYLRWIVERRLAAGRAFCEWGSGFGVVTMLAALHEFDACGIEVELELVDQARRLAEDFEIPAEFAQGSLVPEQWTELADHLDDVAYIETDSPSGYDELGMEIADFDLFYAFPWPGEERFLEDMFDHYAADGALLLTYHGINELRLQRRVRG